jgi:hypothetical protein
MFPLGTAATSAPFTEIIGRVVVSVMVSFRLATGRGIAPSPSL